MKRLIHILLFCLPFFAVAQQGTEPILVTDLLKIKNIGSTAISPDGKLAVISVKSILPDPDKKEDYRYSTQLWMKNLQTTDTIYPITNHNESASQAVFSPDGKTILFIRSVENKPQLFMLPLSGGEALQLTDFRYGVNNPVWSPQGDKIAFTATISLNDLLKDSILNPEKEIPKWPFEKPRFPDNEHLRKNEAKADANGDLASIRAYLQKNERDNKAKVFNKLNFQNEAATSTEINLSHIFVVDAKPGAEPKPVTAGFYSFFNPHFIKNDQLAFSGVKNDEEHPDRIQENQLYTAHLDGTNLKLLVGEKGKRYQLGATSKSGRLLAYTQYEVGIPDAGKLFVLNTDQPEKQLDLSLDRSTSNFSFTDDERHLYHLVQRNGATVLYKTDLRNGNKQALSSDDEGISAYALADNKLIFALTNVSNPSELYEADTDLKKRQPISKFNTSWLSKKQLASPVKHTFENDEGMMVEYWVMKPKGFEQNKKYPLLLEIHGGPAAMWGPGDAGMWHEYQYFCAQGYGVVYSNPRGSGGYGNAFLRANIKNWGEGPSRDVLTALDKTINEGWADTSKLVVTGGSYAGYLVNWIIGHDQRFKAACSQRGVYDLNTFFGEGNAWRLVPNYFGGYPWQQETRPILERESPLRYVEQIKTPYIIFHGENDLRTGVIQSEMLYKSLKVLGRQVEYVRHPGATHEITRSGDNRQRIDQMLRTYEFFERHIQ